jgi:hypothetical protein
MPSAPRSWLASPSLGPEITVITISQDRIREIARLVHGAIRIHGHYSGEMWQPSWKEASDGDRAAAIAGVKAVVSGNANSPEALHAARMSGHLGTTRSIEALSAEERQKSELFRAIVVALVDGPCEKDCHDRGCRKPSLHCCHLDTCLSEFGIAPTEPAA